MYWFIVRIGVFLPFSSFIFYFLTILCVSRLGFPFWSMCFCLLVWILVTCVVYLISLSSVQFSSVQFSLYWSCSSVLPRQPSPIPLLLSAQVFLVLFISFCFIFTLRFSSVWHYLSSVHSHLSVLPSIRSFMILCPFLFSVVFLEC